MGISDAIKFNGILATNDKDPHSDMLPVSICADKVNGGQFQQTFVSWFEKNTDKGADPMSLSVWMAFQSAWPCSPK
jgi:hypothetical protein